MTHSVRTLFNLKRFVYRYILKRRNNFQLYKKRFVYILKYINQSFFYKVEKYPATIWAIVRAKLYFYTQYIVLIFSYLKNNTSCKCTFIQLSCIRLYLKSKSVVNWLFIFWKIGSWAVACALRARDSDAALEKVVVTLETFSIPTPNVLTNFLTKFSVCGVMVASATVGQ